MPILEFSISPVQGFIAQARRTRDSAVGSFLLSYLSGHAMRAIPRNTETKFEYPNVDADPLYQALGQSNGQGPDIGSLPNTFKAHVPDGFDPGICQTAALDAWKRIADAVWQKYLEPVAHLGQHGAPGVKAIWDAQINGFWEIVWVLSSSEFEAEGALAKRKNWRSHQPPVQPGDHCTLMGDWQELSGFVRAHEPTKQQAFWKALRDNSSNLNLGLAERLCAIALVKRFFPLLDQATLKHVIGWPVNFKNWPSVSYMAAVPWLEALFDSKEPEVVCKAVAFKNAIHDSEAFQDFQGEYRTNLAQLRSSAAQHPARGLLDLDGSLLLPSSYEAGENLPWKPELEGPNKRAKRVKKLEPIRKALTELNDALGQQSSPYYALLLMDGDSMGKLKDELGKQNSGRGAFDLSSRLGRFATGVPSIVSEHNGKTIFAGGDDVLALVPLTNALEVARRLRTHYQQQFTGVPAATISAAVVFAHVHVSLKTVIAAAHHLLDDVAKDGNGRDSLAVMALNGNGALWDWVSTWDWHEDEWPHTTKKFVDVIEAIKRVQSTFENDKFSSKFFYKLRERFASLTDEQGRFDLTTDTSASQNVLHATLIAEYLKTRDGSGNDDARRSEASERVAELLAICRSRTSTARDKPDQRRDEQRTLLPDGALMVRFLARKGVGA